MGRAGAFVLVGLALWIAGTAPAGAGVALIGDGWIGSNDQYGDGEDRWRTAALTVSLLFGPEGRRAPTTRFGSVVEARLHGALLTPESVDDPDPADRPYAAQLSFGLHGHARRGATDLRLGADLVMIGPHTGLDDLQTWVHEILPGQPSPAAAQAEQIGNSWRLAVSGEAAHTIPLGDGLRIRPFAEARAGDEALARIGADLTLGRFGETGLLLRDTVTGQLYQGFRTGDAGLSLVLGVDVAAVGSSVWLPGGDAPAPHAMRARARAGIVWRAERFELHSGVTWLGPEFEGQAEGQRVGSAWLQTRF